MKKIIIMMLVMVTLFSSLLVGCVRVPNDNGDNTLDHYTVTFNLNSGSGNAPVIPSKESGESFSIPTANVSKTNYTFGGWVCDNSIYNAGDTFTMPSKNVTFYARWISQVKDSYPVYFDLDNGKGSMPNLGDVEVGTVFYIPSEKVTKEYCTFLGWQYGNTIYSAGDEFTMPAKVVTFIAVWREEVVKFSQSSYTYNSSTGGNIEVTLDTFGGDVGVIEIDSVFVDEDCWGFDATRKVLVVYEGFLKNLINGDHVIQAYTSVGSATCVIKVTNSTSGTVIFLSDYDANTIHDTKVSNTGQNSLYQYSDNVSIVSAPSGASGAMTGNVLKFTPNIVQVNYECHGIFTIRSQAAVDANRLVCWYNGGFKTNKNYYITFDYLTEGLEGSGLLEFRQEGSAWCDNLLYGGNNNGVVHSYSRLIKGTDMGNGIILWAFFNGATNRGSIYIDNFRIVEINQ